MCTTKCAIISRALNIGREALCLVTETGGEVTLGGLGDAATSRLDMELPISLDGRGKLPLCVPGE